MKHKDDSLEWHDENELVRRVDVVEAVLNLADDIDDVVDVIMSVPTYKVYTTTNVAMGSGGVSTTKDRKTENSSEIPNNCEHITEDGVTCAKYPACDDCPDNPLNKVKGSERLVKGSEKPNKSEIPTCSTISKMEQVETMSCQECKHWDVYKGCRERVCKYEPKDEPTGYNLTPVEDEPQTGCIKCKHFKKGRTIIENGHCRTYMECMASECSYEPKDEPQTERSE